MWSSASGREVGGVQVDPSTLVDSINQIWILYAASLVFFMHAGFGMFEVGQYRAKNSSHQLSKNIMTWSAGIIGYFAFGGAVAAIVAGLTGPSTLDIGAAFAYQNGGSVDFTYWLFGGTFAMATASIVSGAIGGRSKLSGYVVYALAVGTIVYPVAVGLVWSGGWLAQIGFIDFAGAGVVHLVGGTAAITAVYILGPRIDKFNEDGSANVIPGHSTSLMVLGTLMLAFGWFGFMTGTVGSVFTLAEGGSGVELGGFEMVGRVAMNTALASGAGVVGAVAYPIMKGRTPDPDLMSIGMLSGLVTVCAFGHIAGGFGTIVVSLIAGFQAPIVENYQEKLGLDDVVLAFPVHGTAGIVGLLAVPFFVPGGFTLEQLGIQIVGIVVLGAWAAVSCAIIYGILAMRDMARVDRSSEIEGLDNHAGDVNYPEFVAGGGTPTEKVADGGEETITDGGSEQDTE